MKRDYIRFPVTSRFKVVHVDLVGPLPRSQSGKRWLMTMIDRFTRWVEAIPISTITTVTLVRTFYTNWVARYGCPSVVNDQGAQFTSGSFKRFLNLMGTEHRLTNA